MSPPQPELETDLLFVYGTLRRGRALHHHLKRLGAEFIAIGKAQAELFDLGKHPGARGYRKGREVSYGGNLSPSECGEHVPGLGSSGGNLSAVSGKMLVPAGHYGSDQAQR